MCTHYALPLTRPDNVCHNNDMVFFPQLPWPTVKPHTMHTKPPGDQRIRRPDPRPQRKAEG